MHVVIAGGSGLIGRLLISKLSLAGYDTIILTRHPERITSIAENVYPRIWDGKSIDDLPGYLENAYAVINLSGAPISTRRWSRRQKERILSSRIETTHTIVSALERTKCRPSVLLNASAVGYYGNTSEDEVTEEYPRGGGFLCDVCHLWETEAIQASKYGVRVIMLRTGIVLDKNAGALPKILWPMRFFLGGPLGSGRQWFPWIHGEDEARAILFTIEHPNIEGPLNLAAPNSIRMQNFFKVLGNILHRPSWFHVPESVLRLMLGEMAEPILLSSQRIVPKKLLDAGFIFRYPHVQEALLNIIH